MLHSAGKRCAWFQEDLLHEVNGCCSVKLAETPSVIERIDARWRSRGRYHYFADLGRSEPGLLLKHQSNDPTN